MTQASSSVQVQDLDHVTLIMWLKFCTQVTQDRLLKKDMGYVRKLNEKLSFTK